MKKIKVILADDNENTRASIRRLLELDDNIDIVAEASSGQEVIEKVAIMEPEVVLMDYSMPEMDGIETTRYLTLHHPHAAVIIVSIYDEVNYFRKAMLAGAKEYLVKPLSPVELNTTIHQVAELNRQKNSMQQPVAEEHVSEKKDDSGKIITIFGTKGGVGKSVLCTNMAVAAAQRCKGKVSLIDLDVQFGDAAILMNVNPRKTIAELMQESEQPGPQLMEDYLYERNGVYLLAAPNKPELAELVTSTGVKNSLKVLRQMFCITFVDTPSFIDDITLTALEESDLILLAVTLDLPTIKNVRKGIDILQSLQLLGRTRLILNRSSGVAGIEAWDVERVLDMKIRGEVPSDGKLVVSSVNQGIPFVKLNPRAQVSRSVHNLIRLIED